MDVKVIDNITEFRLEVKLLLLHHVFQCMRIKS